MHLNGQAGSAAPVAAVEVAVADGLADMVGSDVGRGVEIGDGARIHMGVAVDVDAPGDFIVLSPFN